MDKMPEPPQGARPIKRERHLPDELEEIAALVARMENPFDWFHQDPDELERFVRIAIRAIDGEDDDPAAEMLPILYASYAETADFGQRRNLLLDTWYEAARGDADASVLLALAMYESEPLLIGIATECYACLRSTLEGEVFSVARRFLDMFDDFDDAHQAGLFYGLMVLGVQEVLEELKPYRWELNDEQVLTVCSLPLGGTSAAVHLFLLGWLEDSLADRDHARSHAIAGALAIEGGNCLLEPTEQTENLEVTGPPQLLLDDEPFACIPAREFARHIEPRLRVLAEHETGWPLAPTILESWDLAAHRGAN